MTQTDIEALRELERRATAGPWSTSDWSKDDGPNQTTVQIGFPEILSPGQSSIWPDGIEHRRVAETSEGENPLPDAAFIAAARNAMPGLLDEVERLRAGLREISLKALPAFHLVVGIKDEFEKGKAYAFEETAEISRLALGDDLMIRKAKAND